MPIQFRIGVVNVIIKYRAVFVIVLPIFFAQLLKNEDDADDEIVRCRSGGESGAGVTERNPVTVNIFFFRSQV